MTTTLQNIMTKKLTAVVQGTAVQHAQKQMQDLRIRHLPVVDDADNIIGLLSQRDLNLAQGARNVPVELVMSTPVHSMAQGTSIRRAIFKMLELKISSLLVSDENENAVGIVTTDDLLWFLAHKLSDEAEERPVISAMDKQTIGELAQRISDMGI